MSNAISGESADKNLSVDPDDDAQARSDMSGRQRQAFPVLAAEQIEHLLPFGECRHWTDDDLLFEAGPIGPGMCVVHSGKVAVTRRDRRARSRPC